MEKKVQCAGCPRCCTITVTKEEGQELQVKGNGCGWGEQYAKKKAAE